MCIQRLGSYQSEWVVLCYFELTDLTEYFFKGTNKTIQFYFRLHFSLQYVHFLVYLVITWVKIRYLVIVITLIST